MTSSPRGEDENVRLESVSAPRPWWGRLGASLFYLSLLGPGVVAAVAGDDAGGIATYSTVGASYGYQLLWALALMTVSLAVVQEMSARLGAVTGQGLADLIRERFGLRWTAITLLALLVANAATTASEFAGIAAALELVGVSKYISVPVAAVSIWILVVWGSYRRVERVFLAMSLALLAYPATVFLIGPDWGEIARQVVSPTFSLTPDYLVTLVAMTGTTITPYMQIFAQSATAEKGVDLEYYGWERADAYLGAVATNVIAFFIIVSTAAILFPLGIRVETAADAAQALVPLAGPLAGLVFALGLLGGSILAAGVVPLATAYPISEALGLERGVSRSFRDAPAFMGVFTGLIVLGALITLIPGLPLVPLLILVQVVNGLLLPVVLVSIVRLSGDRDLVGVYANGRIYGAVGWITVFVVSALSLAMVGIVLLGTIGITFGS